MWISRRRFVGLMAGAVAAGCDREPPRCGQPTRSGLECSDPALEAMVVEILETDRSLLLERTVEHLRDGRSHDELAFAAFLAGIRASSFTWHSNHPVKAVESARQLALTLSGPERHIALLWAVDGVSATPGGIRNPRDEGTPIGPLDDVTLPCADAAYAELARAMQYYDSDAAQRAIVAVYRHHGPDAAFDALARWCARSLIPNGHHAIALAQYSRILSAHGWTSPEPTLRQLAVSISIATETEAHRQLKEHAASMPANWADGALDDGAAIQLLQALRTAEVEDAGTATAQLLRGGISPQSIWDAAFLHAAEAVVFGGDEHAVTSVNALHDVYTRTGDPDARLLLLLSAPGWAASMAGAGNIDTLAADTPPATAAEVALAPTPEERMALALGWLEAGGSEQDLIDATHQRVVQSHSEWHGYKVPVAQHQTALAASATFTTRLRAAHAIAYARSGGTRWSRYDEALSLVADLD